MSIDALIEKYSGRRDVHITRVMGAFVVISNGQILEVDRTKSLTYCPLQALLNHENSIDDYIYSKMQQYGHFTRRRELKTTSLGVPFGTSEMLMSGLRKGVLDCAIVVCDGAGTVVTTDPDVVQGIGARMNGLFYTSPILEVQKLLREYQCRFFEDARIDQLAGLREAVKAGCTKIGITVNSHRGESLADIRNAEKKANVQVTIAAICSTDIRKDRADEIATYADLGWTCASQHMRDFGSRAFLQITLGIPIFAYTTRGIELVSAYSDKDGAVRLKKLDTSKQYLLASGSGKQGIILGQKHLALSEAVLPVVGKHVPTTAV